MKAKSRKRLLISSIAMLLVAMIALGTATFAWFTSSTTATADGINVRTSKTSTLKISDNSRIYSTGFSYNEDGSEYKPTSIMIPSSSVNGTAWYTTVAQDTSKFDPVTSPAPTSVTTAKYVYMNQLNIKNAGTIAVDDITITITGFSSSYARVALVPATAKAGTGVAVASIATGKSFADYVFADNNTAYKPITAAGTLPGTSDTSITPTAIPAAGLTITKTTPGFSDLASLAGGANDDGAELHYNLYVWFEGQDPDCKDANAGFQALSNLSFTVSGTPHSEA